MAKKKTSFVVVTALFMLAALPGAIGNLAQPEALVEMAGILELPLYLMTLIGIWKVLGVIAIGSSLLPGPARFPRIVEWAYAGFFFDLTGAAWCHGAVGDVGGVFPPLVVAGILMGSYFLRPAADGG